MLEAGHPKSWCQQCWFLLEALREKPLHASLPACSGFRGPLHPVACPRITPASALHMASLLSLCFFPFSFLLSTILTGLGASLKPDSGAWRLSGLMISSWEPYLNYIDKDPIPSIPSHFTSSGGDTVYPTTPPYFTDGCSGVQRGEIPGLPPGVSEGAAQQCYETLRQIRWHLIDPALLQNMVFPWIFQIIGTYLFKRQSSIKNTICW